MGLISEDPPIAVTDEMIKAHASEWERWTVRKNKMPMTTTYEVVRLSPDDEPISDDTLKVVENYPGDREYAEYRMEHLRTQFSIEAALKART
jgi:hypothetical protein